MNIPGQMFVTFVSCS